MKSSDLEEFSTNVANLLTNISTSDFQKNLQELLDSIIPYSNLFLLKFVSGNKPEEIFSWVPEDTLNQFYEHNYFNFAYQLDPYYQLATRQAADGVFPLKQIAPDRFFACEYYKVYYINAKMGDEIGILTKVSDSVVIHLSIGRLIFEPNFSKHEIRRIKQHEFLICTLLRIYYQYGSAKFASDISGISVQPMELRLKNWCLLNTDSHLTDREAQITALILQGHSSCSAAMLLDISTETVKVHRKNIYRKLKVGTQAELFSRLSKLLIHHGDVATN